MFQTPPKLHYIVPKNKHYILSGLATTLLIFGTALIGLSLGTDHWRESSKNQGNVTYVIQGLRHECDKMQYSVKCINIENSRFANGVLGPLEIINGLLIEAVACGVLALVTSFVASFHKRAILVIAVVAMEATMVLVSVVATACYSFYFIRSPWTPGWSYFLSWTAILSVAISTVLHFILQDVKFLGKKICT